MKPETDLTTQSLHSSAIAPYLNPGERFHSNYGVKRPLGTYTQSLEEYVVSLRQSGKFQSVRTSEDAVFDVHGEKYEGAVAIFVIPIPEV